MFRRHFPAFVAFLAAVLTFSSSSQQDKPLPVKFYYPELIRYDHNGFTLRGKDVFVYSGSFHYFRCDSSEWRDRLEKIKAAGFNTIETYVPWNWHEREEGRTDFAALDKFLTQCEQLGLYAIVRPGPYICAGWDVGGFPEWLAGKDVGFRTDSPEDVRWSKYWYDEVLPVIRRHLITNGGNVIAVQIENEYDYFDLSDKEKAVYIKSLYENVIKNGIDVPIITCWTKQVRDKTDSVFSQILDACNFYPGWNIESTLPAIEKMKSEEPISPPMITELQGGWFSSVGDKSVRHVESYGHDQINALTKFVIAHGVKALNYYMLYGGTNFGYWGSKGRTTSYDYTAPISEPGGLWEKYRSVKLIGDFVKLAGKYLVRSHEIKGAAVSETKGVEMLLRADGAVGFLFVWNTNHETVNAQVAVKPPQGSPFTLSVAMRPKDAYFLPVNYPLSDGKTLYYSNVQISAVTEYNGKPLIIAYGNPGDEAKIYAGASLCAETIKDTDQLFDWDGVYVLLTTKERASRYQVFETSSGPVSLVSDSYLTLPGSSDNKNLSVNLRTRPGNDSFSLLAPSGVSAVSIDGKTVKAKATPRTNVLTFSFNTPQMKPANIPISNVRVRPDDEAPAPSSFTKLETTGDDFASLDSQGDYQNGYTIYTGDFALGGKKLLKLDYYDDDWHTVIIDGKLVPGFTGSNEEDFAAVDLAEGTHKIEIVYENEGRPNSGFMEQQKGLKSLSVLLPGQIELLSQWKFSPTPSEYPSGSPNEASSSFDDSKWQETEVGKGPQAFLQDKKEGRWFRIRIQLSDDAVKLDPRILFKGVDDNAVVYVNGKFAAEHKGWDKPFTSQLGGLVKPGENVVAIYVENAEGPGGIYRPVLFEWGKPTPVKANLEFHHSLKGELAGWQAETFNNSSWKTSPKYPSGNRWTHVSSLSEITWYRGEFILPDREGWVIPWRVHIESTGSMQIWLNGRLLGRYFAEGPQNDFYLPKGWLKADGKNTLALVLRHSGKGTPVIKNIFVAPYEDYVVQKHTLNIMFK